MEEAAAVAEMEIGSGEGPPVLVLASVRALVSVLGLAGLLVPGDFVWVHDYHLMRVPALLRQRIPDARIGFFLHIPFPNPEIFFTLPTRRWLVEGMLGADLIGHFRGFVFFSFAIAAMVIKNARLPRKALLDATSASKATMLP